MTHRVYWALVLVLGAAGAAAQGRPNDYPQWRGLTRDGSASAFEIPARWPEQLVRRWRVDVGDGYATPLLVGDSVYTFTRRGGQEVATALDVATGARRWESGYALAYSPSEPAKAHGAGPKATPAFADGTLVTMGISGVVSAFDAASGRRLWQTAPPTEPPFFSAAASPLSVGALVLTHPGNYDPLTAFDRRTGAVRWRVGAGGFFMSPVMAQLDGVTQVVTFTQEGLLGVDSSTGALHWRFPWKGGGTGGTTPIVDRGLVIVAAGATGMLAVRPTRLGNTWMVDRAWETPDASMYTSNPVLIDGVVYGLSDRSAGRFVAVDAASGTVLWQGPGREARQAALVKAGSLLIALTDEGRLLVTRPSRQGLERIATYTVADSATWAQPLLSGQRILVKDVSSLSLWTLD